MTRRRRPARRSRPWSATSSRSRRAPSTMATPDLSRRLLAPGISAGTPPQSDGHAAEDDRAAYERLKPQLATLWKDVFPSNDAHYTSVIVPSVSTDAQTLLRHGEALVYEEVLLFLLIRLRNPKARVIYLTSRPLAAAIREYYLQFLAGIPASHAAARLTFLSAHDGSPRPLAEKILERPRLVERIRARIPDPARAYLTVLRATPLER